VLSAFAATGEVIICRIAARIAEATSSVCRRATAAPARTTSMPNELALAIAWSRA